MRLLFLAALLLPGGRAAIIGHLPLFDKPYLRWANDMRAKNSDDILALYTPDAIFIQPDGSKVIGRAGLRKLFRQVFSTYDSDLQFNMQFVTSPAQIQGKPLPPVLQTNGSYTEQLRTRATGQLQTICGQYEFTWKRQPNDQWLLSQQRWLPPTPCPTIHQM